MRVVMREPGPNVDGERVGRAAALLPPHVPVVGVRRAVA
jgi:hypothetical protein